MSNFKCNECKKNIRINSSYILLGPFLYRCYICHKVIRNSVYQSFLYSAPEFDYYRKKLDQLDSLPRVKGSLENSCCNLS
jgi:hypothetical protein